LSAPPDAQARALAKRLKDTDRIASAPYVLKPHGQQFTKGAKLTLPIAKQQRGRNLAVAWLEDEDDLNWKFYRIDQLEGDTAGVTLKHFSVVMLVLAQGDEPSFDGDGGTDVIEDDAGADDSGMDSGTDSGLLLPTTMCGTTLCEGIRLASTIVSPCCLEEDNACGLDADDIKKASPGSPFTGCVPKDVAAASDSEYCGAVFDQIEPDGDHTNAGLDIMSGTRFAVFDGCCLPTGECGANISVPRGADPDSLNHHLGCVSFGRLNEAFTDPDAGEEEPPTPEHLPFCHPENGEAPTTGTVPGVPAFVCGCGAGNLDDGEGPRCLNNLPPEVCGAGE
jgi:hypothetical protein